MGLTCGFLVCMCCVVCVFGAGAIAVFRTNNLGEVLDTVGKPQGWTRTDSSQWPWGVTAELSGPPDSAAVYKWLDSAGDKSTHEQVAVCLDDSKGCHTNFSVDGHDVVVKYSAGDDDEASATVEVG